MSIGVFPHTRPITMGIDLPIIAIRIEETFDVSLSGDDLMEIMRDQDILVGDFYDLVLAKLDLRDVARNSVSLNAAVWRGLQGLLHSITNVPLEQIALKTPLETLFPLESRRKTWEALRAACPYRIRKLDYPRAVRTVGFLMAAIVVLLEHFQLWQIAWLRWLWPVLGILGLWMLVETYAKILSIFSPLRTALPSGMTTVKDFCRAVLGANYEEICRDVEIPHDERCLEVWRQLTDILIEELDIDPDQITFRSRLIGDLGMG